jgi:protein TonB
MAYADQQMSGNKITAFVIVALIHIAIGYGLISGLAYEAVEKIAERVTAVDIEEPPPPEEEPPPPPEPQKDVAPPPPVAPPVRVNVNPNPPPVRTTQIIPPPAPPVLRIPPPAPVVAPPPPPPPPPPPAPSQARPAQPNMNSLQRIRRDYPNRAQREGREGTVTMRITVGANGRVSACTVTGSSGHSDLDSAACRGMQRYARFEPALNDAGNPISATTNFAFTYQLN